MNNLENVTEKAICKELTLNETWYGNNVLPSLNNLLSEASRSPMAYNRLKKKLEMLVINQIRLQLKGWKPAKRVQIHYVIAERSKGVKRDYDNISAGARKIIQDALVKSGTLYDDAPKYLAPSTDEFLYVEKPYIKIQIRELED